MEKIFRNILTKLLHKVVYNCEEFQSQIFQGYLKTNKWSLKEDFITKTVNNSLKGDFLEIQEMEILSLYIKIIWSGWLPKGLIARLGDINIFAKWKDTSKTVDLKKLRQCLKDSFSSQIIDKKEPKKSIGAIDSITKSILSNMCLNIQKITINFDFGYLGYYKIYIEDIEIKSFLENEKITKTIKIDKLSILEQNGGKGHLILSGIKVILKEKGDTKIQIDKIEGVFEEHNIKILGEIYVPFRFSTLLSDEIGPFKIFLDSKEKNEKKIKIFEKKQSNIEISSIDIQLIEAAPAPYLRDINYKMTIKDLKIINKTEKKQKITDLEIGFFGIFYTQNTIGTTLNNQVGDELLNIVEFQPIDASLSDKISMIIRPEKIEKFVKNGAIKTEISKILISNCKVLNHGQFGYNSSMSYIFTKMVSAFYKPVKQDYSLLEKNEDFEEKKIFKKISKIITFCNSSLYIDTRDLSGYSMSLDNFRIENEISKNQKNLQISKFFEISSPKIIGKNNSIGYDWLAILDLKYTSIDNTSIGRNDKRLSFGNISICTTPKLFKKLKKLKNKISKSSKFLGFIPNFGTKFASLEEIIKEHQFDNDSNPLIIDTPDKFMGTMTKITKNKIFEMKPFFDFSTKFDFFVHKISLQFVYDQHSTSYPLKLYSIDLKDIKYQTGGEFKAEIRLEKLFEKNENLGFLKIFGTQGSKNIEMVVEDAKFELEYRDLNMLKMIVEQGDLLKELKKSKNLVKISNFTCFEATSKDGSFIIDNYSRHTLPYILVSQMVLYINQKPIDLEKFIEKSQNFYEEKLDNETFLMSRIDSSGCISIYFMPQSLLLNLSGTTITTNYSKNEEKNEFFSSEKIPKNEFANLSNMIQIRFIEAKNITSSLIDLVDKIEISDFQDFSKEKKFENFISKNENLVFTVTKQVEIQNSDTNRDLKVDVQLLNNSLQGFTHLIIFSKFLKFSLIYSNVFYSPCTKRISEIEVSKPLYYIKDTHIKIEEDFEVECDNIFKKILQKKISILVSKTSKKEAIIEPQFINETLGIINRIPYCIIKNQLSRPIFIKNKKNEIFKISQKSTFYYQENDPEDLEVGVSIISDQSKPILESKCFQILGSFKKTNQKEQFTQIVACQATTDTSILLSLKIERRRPNLTQVTINPLITLANPLKYNLYYFYKENKKFKILEFLDNSELFLPTDQIPSNFKQGYSTLETKQIITDLVSSLYLLYNNSNQEKELENGPKYKFCRLNKLTNFVAVSDSRMLKMKIQMLQKSHTCIIGAISPDINKNEKNIKNEKIEKILAVPTRGFLYFLNSEIFQNLSIMPQFKLKHPNIQNLVIPVRYMLDNTKKISGNFQLKIKNSGKILAEIQLQDFIFKTSQFYHKGTMELKFRKFMIGNEIADQKKIAEIQDFYILKVKKILFFLKFFNFLG